MGSHYTGRALPRQTLHMKAGVHSFPFVSNKGLSMKSIAMRGAVVAAALALMTAAACGSDSPPTIPHDITSTDASYCLGCHKDGVNGAPKTPHPDRTGCTNCHKAQ